MGAIDTNYKAPEETPQPIQTPLIVTDPIPPAGDPSYASTSTNVIEIKNSNEGEKFTILAQESLTALIKQVKDLQTRVEILELKALSR